MNLGPHAAFILAAYGAAAAVIAGLFVWLLSDRAGLKRELRQLEAHDDNVTGKRP